MPIRPPNLDDRRYDDIVREAKALVPQYCPEWTNLGDADPGITLVQLFAWMTEMTIYRLNRVPDKTYIHFLNFIGEERRQARPAMVPVTFEPRTEGDAVPEIPAYTRCSTKMKEGRDALHYLTTEMVTVHNSNITRVVAVNAGIRPMVREIPFDVHPICPKALLFGGGAGIQLFKMDPIEHGPRSYTPYQYLYIAHDDFRTMDFEPADGQKVGRMIIRSAGAENLPVGALFKWEYCTGEEGSPWTEVELDDEEADVLGMPEIGLKTVLPGQGDMKHFGTEEDLARLVETAHRHGIRIVMDVIINHTGPVTDLDPVWPDEWVRTGPRCTYQDYESTVTCTLVENLPDIRTESDQEVELPLQLLEKWSGEGRLEQELAGLDAFFARTGYPRAPRYYLIKWLTDFVRKYGIDGYRLDTAKHIEEDIWGELGKEARFAFARWKEEHPELVLDDRDFYMVGEVYGYGISGDRMFGFGDRDVDFFAQGIDAMINFEFKERAKMSFEQLFSYYSEKLNGPLKGVSVLNYISSHDDGGPFDKTRRKVIEAGTKLLLTPGASQIYYGDESSRLLEIPGTKGDANLRSFMNWEELESNTVRNGVPLSEVSLHYQKLGQFRKAHPAVGAGLHQMISEEPYLFSRVFERDGYRDQVVAGLDLDPGEKEIELGGLFEEGSVLRDYYSGSEATVREGRVTIDSPHDVVLLGL